MDFRLLKTYMVDQDSIFFTSEADRWFQRNINAIISENKIKDDIAFKILDLYSEIRPLNILEIGCANGYRLNEMNRRWGSSCVGIEPSQSAIEDGFKRYENIKFLRGTASSIPIADRTFDLVIVNFVFHWVDRSQLLKSVSEIDRMIAPQGYFLIGDFLPDFPTRRHYHHLPESLVFTYKQDYAKLFLDSNLYEHICRVTFNADTGKIDANCTTDQRGFLSLLKKKSLATEVNPAESQRQ